MHRHKHTHSNFIMFLCSPAALTAGIYLHHQRKYIFPIFFSIISITRTIMRSWWELHRPSWWIKQTDRRGGRNASDGTRPKSPLGHRGVLWGSLQSIKQSLWNNEGPAARGRARGCSGLICRPRGARSGLTLADVHPQLPTSIFLCFCHHKPNRYHKTVELCLKGYPDPKHMYDAPAAACRTFIHHIQRHPTAWVQVIWSIYKKVFIHLQFTTKLQLGHTGRLNHIIADCIRLS